MLVLAGDVAAAWALAQEPRSPADVARAFTEAVAKGDCGTARRLATDYDRALCELAEPQPGVAVRAVRVVDGTGRYGRVEVDLDTPLGPSTTRVYLNRVAGRWRVLPDVVELCSSPDGAIPTEGDCQPPELPE